MKGYNDLYYLDIYKIVRVTKFHSERIDIAKSKPMTKAQIDKIFENIATYQHKHHKISLYEYEIMRYKSGCYDPIELPHNNVYIEIKWAC